jgi:glutathione S-transferase
MVDHLSYIESELQKTSAFLCGVKPTYADIFVAVILSLFETHHYFDITEAKFPLLVRWKQSILNMKSVLDDDGLVSSLCEKMKRAHSIPKGDVYSL